MYGQNKHKGTKAKTVENIKFGPILGQLIV